jgi:hypothetical protein
MDWGKAKKLGMGSAGLFAALVTYGQIKDLFFTREEGAAHAQRLSAIENVQLIQAQRSEDLRKEVNGAMEKQVDRVLRRMDLLEYRLGSKIKPEPEE